MLKHNILITLLFLFSSSLVCLDSPEVIAARMRRRRMHQESFSLSSSDSNRRPRRNPSLERGRVFHPGNPLPQSGTAFDEPPVRGLARAPLGRPNHLIRQRFRYASTRQLDQIIFESPER